MEADETCSNEEKNTCIKVPSYTKGREGAVATRKKRQWWRSAQKTKRDRSRKCFEKTNRTAPERGGVRENQGGRRWW